MVVAVIVSTCVLMELGARLAIYGMEYWRPDYRAEADGYVHASWTRDYYKEFLDSGEVEWQSYVYWRRRPYRGTFINIDQDGIRRTWRSPSLTGDSPSVFVLGGSTVWGTGARDDYTLPSHLARALDAQGHPSRVVNYGESGYVTAQALAILVQRLRRGDVPDVVVFYGGVEDVFSAFQNGEAGLPQNEANRRLEFNSTQPERLDKTWLVMTSGLGRLGDTFRNLFVSTSRAAGNDGTRLLAQDVIDQYCSTLRVADALGRQYGFRAVYYWQPVIFTKQPLTTYESAARDRYAYARPFFDDVYRRIAAGTDPCRPLTIRDISRIFAQDPGPVYVDAFHMTEQGNQRVAAEIVPPVIAGLAEGRR